jgi:hypothetical protein
MPPKEDWDEHTESCPSRPRSPKNRPCSMTADTRDGTPITLPEPTAPTRACADDQEYDRPPIVGFLAHAYFGSIRTVSGSNPGPGRGMDSTVTVIRLSSTARRRPISSPAHTAGSGASTIPASGLVAVAPKSRLRPVPAGRRPGRGRSELRRGSAHPRPASRLSEPDAGGAGRGPQRGQVHLRRGRSQQLDGIRAGQPFYDDRLDVGVQRSGFAHHVPGGAALARAPVARNAPARGGHRSDGRSHPAHR